MSADPATCMINPGTTPRSAHAPQDAYCQSWAHRQHFPRRDCRHCQPRADHMAVHEYVVLLCFEFPDDDLREGVK